MTTTYAPILSTAVDTRPETGTARFHWIMGALLAGVIVLGAVLEPSLALERFRLFGCLAPSLMALWYCHWAGHWRVVDLLTWPLYVCCANIAIMPILAAAAHNAAPFADEIIARRDAYVFQTADLVRWMRAHTVLNISSVVVYASVFPVAGLIGLAPLLRYRDSSRRFVLAGVIALLLTMAGFALLPAIGSWTIEGYPPTIDQFAAETALRAMKAHSIQSPASEGIVAFPIFRTTLAILSACALWPIRWMRWSTIILAAPICLSTITAGWHYGVDVVGGALVAVFSRRLGRRMV